MYKKRKYNTIVVVLLFLISIIAGVSAGMSPAKPVFVDENTDDSLIELVPDESGKPSKFIAPDENATAFERIAFGFDVVENGDGFTAMSNLQIEAAGHKQQIVSKHYRAFNYDVSEEWAKMDGLLSSKGKNRFMLMYTDSEILKIKRIYDADHYSFEKKLTILHHKLHRFKTQLLKNGLQRKLRLTVFSQQSIQTLQPC